MEVLKVTRNKRIIIIAAIVFFVLLSCAAALAANDYSKKEISADDNTDAYGRFVMEDKTGITRITEIWGNQ